MGEDKPLGLERRKSPRFKDNIFIFGKLNSGAIGEFKAITEDISVGGLMFETEDNIPKDSKLELEIYQPIDRYKRIIFSVPILARIIWTKCIEKDKFGKGENKYKIGVQFTKVKKEDRKMIAKYVEESLPKNKPVYIFTSKCK